MNAIEVDATRLPLLLHDLRLPAIARLWPDFAERADKEGWPAARFGRFCSRRMPRITVAITGSADDQRWPARR